MQAKYLRGDFVIAITKKCKIHPVNMSDIPQKYQSFLGSGKLIKTVCGAGTVGVTSGTFCATAGILRRINPLVA